MRENLRIFQHCLFTGRVAAENCICSACFLRKRGAAVEYPFRLLTAFAATFPKGTAFGGEGKVHGIAKGVPLGELARRKP